MAKKNDLARQKGRTRAGEGKQRSDNDYGYSHRRGILFTESDSDYEQRQTDREAWKEGYDEKKAEMKAEKAKKK